MAEVAESRTWTYCGDRRSTIVGDGLKLLHLMLLLLLLVVMHSSHVDAACTFQKTCRLEKREVELDCICEKGQLKYPDLTSIIINHESDRTRFDDHLVASLQTNRPIQPDNLKEKNVTVHTQEFSTDNKNVRSRLTIVLNNVQDDELQARYYCVLKMLNNYSRTEEEKATDLSDQGCTITMTTTTTATTTTATTTTATTTTAMVIRTEDPPTTQPYPLPCSNEPSDGTHGMTAIIILIVVSVCLLVVVVVVIICFAKALQRTRVHRKEVLGMKDIGLGEGHNRLQLKDAHSSNKNHADGKQRNGGGGFHSDLPDDGDSDTDASLLPAQPRANTGDSVGGDDQRWVSLAGEK